MGSRSFFFFLKLNIEEYSVLDFKLMHCGSHEKYPQDSPLMFYSEGQPPLSIREGLAVSVWL
jgi:hypothetical protein